VLGPEYAHLEQELIFVMLVAVVQMVGGVLVSLNAARSWTAGMWVAIPVIVCAQVMLLPVLDLRTVEGVAMLNALPFAASWLVCLWQARQGLRAFKHEQSSILNIKAAKS
jgi:hypothetical protein